MAADKRVKITEILFNSNEKMVEEAARIVALSIIRRAVLPSKDNN